MLNVLTHSCESCRDVVFIVCVCGWMGSVGSCGAVYTSVLREETYSCVCVCEIERSRPVSLVSEEMRPSVCFSGSRSGFKSPAEARGLPYPGQLRAANHASDRGTRWAEPAV